MHRAQIVSVKDVNAWWVKWSCMRSVQRMLICGQLLIASQSVQKVSLKYVQPPAAYEYSLHSPQLLQPPTKVPGSHSSTALTTSAYSYGAVAPKERRPA